jgi:hypothetical protein
MELKCGRDLADLLLGTVNNDKLYGFAANCQLFENGGKEPDDEDSGNDVSHDQSHVSDSRSVNDCKYFFSAALMGLFHTNYPQISLG